MDLHLDVWKKNPMTLEKVDYDAIRGTLGKQALINHVPAYTQHWAYVGILRARAMNLREQGINEQGRAMNAQAYEYLNAIPRQIIDDALRSTVDEIRATLDGLLAKDHYTVFDIMKSWACLALLYEKNQDLVPGYCVRLQAKCVGASLPQDYGRRAQQQRLARQSASTSRAGQTDASAKQTPPRLPVSTTGALGNVPIRRLQEHPAAQAIAAESVHAGPAIAQTIPDIIRIHSRASLFDEPARTVPLIIGTALPGLDINGYVVPSLQQARSDEDPTNYCGYYALFNAACFLGQQEERRLDRDLFTELFEQTLQGISHARGHGPYDNLSARELSGLIERNFNEAPIAVVEMAGLATQVQHPELDLGVALDNDRRSAGVLQAFMNGQINMISLIAGLGDGYGHWIAIHAERNTQGAVTIRTADSMHHVGWYNDSQMVVQRILPFYFALITPVQNWPEVLAGLLQEVMAGQYTTGVVVPSPQRAGVQAELAPSEVHSERINVQLERENAILREQLEGFRRALAQERETHNNVKQELGRLQAENAELRIASRERVEVEAMRTENDQLRQRAEMLERHAAAAYQARQVALTTATEHAYTIAQLRIEHGQEIRDLQSRIAELETAVDQAQEPAQEHADQAEDEYHAGAQGLQEQLEQTGQELVATNAMLAALVEHYNLADDQLQHIVEAWVQSHAEDVGPDTDESPAAQSSKK
jgi:hypothetical protein